MVLLKEQYGKQVVVNLLGSRGGEEVLNRAFKVMAPASPQWVGAGGDEEVVPPPQKQASAGSRKQRCPSTFVREVRSLPPTESSSIRWFGLLTGQV